jgi:hypothetical protein
MRILRYLAFAFALALPPGQWSAFAQTVTTPAQTAIACAYNTSLPTLTAATYGLVQCDSAGQLIVTSGPSPAPTVAITPVVSSAAESSKIFKASAGNLYAYQVTTGALAGYVMIFNATSAPADGAVTPIKCVAVPAGATVGVSNNPPEAFSTGITAVFSTTGCFTKTASATAMFSGDVK